MRCDFTNLLATQQPTNQLGGGRTSLTRIEAGRVGPLPDPRLSLRFGPPRPGFSRRSLFSWFRPKVEGRDEQIDLPLDLGDLGAHVADCPRHGLGTAADGAGDHEHLQDQLKAVHRSPRKSLGPGVKPGAPVSLFHLFLGTADEVLYRVPPWMVRVFLPSRLDSLRTRPRWTAKCSEALQPV